MNSLLGTVVLPFFAILFFIHLKIATSMGTHTEFLLVDMNKPEVNPDEVEVKVPRSQSLFRLGTKKTRRRLVLNKVKFFDSFIHCPAIKNSTSHKSKMAADFYINLRECTVIQVNIFNNFYK